MSEKPDWDLALLGLIRDIRVDLEGMRERLAKVKLDIESLRRTVDND